MADKSGGTEKCIHLGRMITNNLYECDEETADCPFKVMFGNGYFCTCNMDDQSDKTAHKPPDYEEYEREQRDI